MARTIENKLVQFAFNHGMDQSQSVRTAPVGTFYTVLNCRKRGPGGILECRPGRSQLASTCLGETTHYIAGDGTTGYVYRPCFLSRIGDSPVLGTTAGEAFVWANGLWNYCGRFSTCLPIAKHVTFSPTKLAPQSTGGGKIFPPQVAINSAGFMFSAAVDSAGTFQACIDTPEGVRQAVTWTSSTTVDAFRVVALGTKFFLWWQSGATVSVNTYVPASGAGGITYSELGATLTLASSSYYWDVTAATDGSGSAMCAAYINTDRSISLTVFNSSLTPTAGTAKAIGSGVAPVSLWRNPSTGDFWLGFTDVSAGALIGTDTNATVNTGVNKTLRYRTDKSLPYHIVNVTSGAGTSKAQIVIDLNADFVLTSVPLVASVVGTNQLQIASTSASAGVPGVLVDIDSTANGSNLNTAVGFPAAGSNSYSGQTYSIFSASLATVLDYATIRAGASSGTDGPPLFGYNRAKSPNDSAAGYAFYAFSFFAATSVAVRGFFYGTASSAGTVQTPCRIMNLIAISKPDNYGRIWCLCDAPASSAAPSTPGFASTRYALLRFFDTAIDSSTPLSIPTIELVTESFPSITQALVDDNSSTARYGRYFTSIVGAVSGGSYFTGLWAPVEQVDGQALGGTIGATTQSRGTLAQATIYEYSGVELDQPKHTHRDVDAVQQTIMTAGQPVELLGQSTSEVIYGISGGTTNFAYSAGASEVGFLIPPSIYVMQTGVTASATPGSGTYLYKAVYQWVDAFGRRHQSAPSVPVSFAADGKHTVDFSVFVTLTTQRQSRNNAQPVEVVIYRTVAGGTQYHETTMRATLNDADATRLLAFSDNLSDANISANAFLYTDGGVLANDIAPSSRFHCRSEDRVWFGGLWDSTIIQCSKILVPGEPIETPESPAFQVQLLRPCTGLSYMDGQVVAFAEDAIFLITGNGPNDQGNGSFSVRPLALTVGCIDYKSIIETENGVLFQSAHGIYRIPRGFGPPEFIGAAVQDEMFPSEVDAPREILDAEYCQTNIGSFANFLLRDSSSSEGGTTRLLMDTNTEEWLEDTYDSSDATRELGCLTRNDTAGIGPGLMFAAASFDSISGTVSPVLYESISQRYDFPIIGSTKHTVAMIVTTSWLTLFGLGGWGRFNKLLGAFETDTIGIKLTLLIHVEGNATQSASWSMTDATQLSIAQYRQLQVTTPQGTAAQAIVILQPVDTNTAANYTAKLICGALEIEPSEGIRLLSDAEKA